VFSYFALVDGLRRAPDSYSDQVYHSQITYHFVPSDGQPRLVKFRMVPGRQCVQTGLLSETGEDQMKPWETARRPGDKRSRCYLRNEFMQRMEGFDAIRYVLQIQISTSLDEALWNPQLVDSQDHFDLLDLLGY
jgi:arachidonate 5-lipoxygenase